MSKAQESIDTKGLLARLEKAGGQWIAAPQFKLLCNSDQHCFGLPSVLGQNDNRRRQYQLAVDNLKRRTPQSYIRLLKLHSATPATATTAKLGGDINPVAGDTPVAVAEVDFDYGSDEDEEEEGPTNTTTTVTPATNELKKKTATAKQPEKPTVAVKEVEKKAASNTKDVVKPAAPTKVVEKPAFPTKEFSTLFASLSPGQHNMESSPPRPPSSVSLMSPSGASTGDLNHIIVGNAQPDIADGT
jgi:hypothetical protein